MTRRLVSGAGVGRFSPRSPVASPRRRRNAGYRPGVEGCDRRHCAMAVAPGRHNNIVKSGVDNGARVAVDCAGARVRSPREAVPAAIRLCRARPTGTCPLPHQHCHGPARPCAGAFPAAPALPLRAEDHAGQQGLSTSKACCGRTAAAIDHDGSRTAGVRSSARAGQRPHRPHRLAAYKQRLSEPCRRRPDYLVSRGVPKDRIETLGMGRQPVRVSLQPEEHEELIAA